MTTWMACVRVVSGGMANCVTDPALVGHLAGVARRCAIARMAPDVIT